jgi:hypothetical protein
MSHKLTIETILSDLKEAGATSFKPRDLAEAVGCTYQTVINYINANPDNVVKIRHGVYGFAEGSFPVPTTFHSVVEEYKINTPEQHVQSVVHEEMTTVSEVISNNTPLLQQNQFDW